MIDPGQTASPLLLQFALLNVGREPGLLNHTGFCEEPRSGHGDQLEQFVSGEQGFICSAHGYLSDTWISASWWELRGIFGMNQGVN